MSDFLADQGEHKEEAEWCTTEKKAYLSAMKDQLPVEFDNLMRIEENRF
jgi:hypothetical protein